MNLQNSLFPEAARFLRKQQRDWKITVARTSLDRFAYQIVFPYLSIYIMALVATAIQLGFVNSVGMVAAGIISPLTWFIDRSGPKKIYLLGIGFLALSYLTYGIAQSWLFTALAISCSSPRSCTSTCRSCSPASRCSAGISSG